MAAWGLSFSVAHLDHPKWRFPKIMGYLLGVPVIRTIVYWGLYWGSLILGNYQMDSMKA